MKSEKDIKKKVLEYIWEVHEDAELKLWPNKNFVRYLLIEPARYKSMRSGMGNRDAFLSFPKNMFNEILGKYGCLTAGFCEHSKGYYHSRINQDFIDVLIVTKGVLSAKFDGKNVNVSAGEVLIIPENCLCDNFVKNVNTYVYWMHLKVIPYWKDIFGDKVFTKKLHDFNQIFSLFNAYSEELYSKHCSSVVLTSVAQALFSIFRREFVTEEWSSKARKSLKDLISAIKSDTGRNWKVEDEAGKLKISTRTLNTLFLQETSFSFAKYVVHIRMEKALAYLKQGGFTNAQIAKKVGYSNAYSFSKAFRNYHKKSPMAVKREIESV